MNIVDIPLEYLGNIANQLITICSILCGFSIAVTANLLINDSNTPIMNNIMKATSFASGCFLVTVFVMTNIVMRTTEGYPFKISANDLMPQRIVGTLAFVMGIISLSIVITLSSWTKSKSLGIFTTIIGVLTLVIILLSV